MRQYRLGAHLRRLLPPIVAEMSTFIPWFYIDLGIVHRTYKFGPEQWKGAPLVANNLLPIIGFGRVVSVLVQWAFIETFPIVDEAAFWSGFALQNMLGPSFLCQLMSRNNTRGHSWSIW